MAALEIVGTTDACARANRYGETLRRHINEVFEEERVPLAAYGTFSMLHIFTNPDHVAMKPTEFDPYQQPTAALAGKRQADVVQRLRLAMMTNGVDFSAGPGGLVSATHSEAELEDTIAALRRAVHTLKQEARYKPVHREAVPNATSELPQLLRHTGGGRYRWRRWIPTFVGMTARVLNACEAWLRRPCSYVKVLCGWQRLVAAKICLSDPDRVARLLIPSRRRRLV